MASPMPKLQSGLIRFPVLKSASDLGFGPLFWSPATAKV